MKVRRMVLDYMKGRRRVLGHMNVSSLGHMNGRKMVLNYVKNSRIASPVISNIAYFMEQ
jgi:hypothetical protein